MKKLLLLALTAIAIMALNSCKKDNGGDDPNPQPGGTTVHVAQIGTLNDLLTKQKLLETSTLTITGVLGEEDFKTLRGMTTLNKLDLTQAAITSLPEYSFYQSKLQEIKLPQTLIEIQQNAFHSCENLRAITFGANSQLRTIGGGDRVEDGVSIVPGAFYGCSSLKAIDIPRSVEVIKGGAFANCTSLEIVNFATNTKLKTLDGAFYNCTSLKHITIPASVTSLFWTFTECSSLSSVDFESSSQLEVMDMAFGESTPLKNIAIPASVTTLDLEFMNCSSLERIIFNPGSRLRIIEDHTFQNCHNLITVDFGQTSQIKTMGNIFYDCTSLENITIPASVTTMKGTFPQCPSLKTITFDTGSQLTTVESGTFSNPVTSNQNITMIDASNCTRITDAGGFADYLPSLQILKIGTRIPPKFFTWITPNSTAVLQVPIGCSVAYKNANFWSEFASIKEL